jgi:very-short-patch-repair endonuclease
VFVGDYRNVSGQENRKRRESQLNRLAYRQGGVVGTEQLGRLGFSYDDIRGRVRRGELGRLHRGVFLVGCPRPYGRGHLFAALLALGDDAFLSHRTAAAAHGLRPIAPSHLEVSVPRKARPRDGLIVHSATPPHPGEVLTRFGLRYSSVSRMLVESGPAGSATEIDRLITQAIRKGIFDPAALARTLDRHPRRPGLIVVRAASARYLDPVDRSSELERSFDDHVAGDPRIPRYRKNVRMGPYELDCVFDEHGLVVELDGRPYHVVTRDMERDNAKNTWLQLHGLRIFRITDFTWEHDRAGAIDDLLAMLALGGWQQAA